MQINGNFLKFLPICAEFSSWGLCGRTQIRSTHSAEFLRMFANEKLLEFLLICAYFSSVEFVWTYAKPLHAQGGVSAYIRKWKTSGVSADMHRLLLLGICVPMYLRKWIISGVSADMDSYWSEKKRHQLTRYADHPILEFPRTYAKKKLRATIWYLRIYANE